MSKTLIAAALVGLAGAAQAQIVVPGGVTEVSTNSGLNTAIRSAARQHQSYYNPSTLPAGSNTISGLQLRLAIGENWRPAGYVGTSWPSQNLNIGTFTITLAKPSAAVVSAGEIPSSATTFAANMASPVTVFTGTVTIPAGAFTADGGATGIHSWGPVFNFGTNYNLNGADGLMVYIQHTGYTPSAELNAFFASDLYAPNSRDAVSNTSSATATTPTGFSNPYFYNLITVPAPSSLALLGVGGLVASRRRR